MINLIYQDGTSGSQYLEDQVTTEVVINFELQHSVFKSFMTEVPIT